MLHLKSSFALCEIRCMHARHIDSYYSVLASIKLANNKILSSIHWLSEVLQPTAPSVHAAKHPSCIKKCKHKLKYATDFVRERHQLELAA